MFKKSVFAYILSTRVGRVVLLIFLGCVVFGYFFICSNLFVVKKVEVLNSKLIDERSLSQCKGKNIFLVPLDSLIEKIDEIPAVKSIIIKKELPNKLTIVIQEYIPCALLRENMKLAVSEEGVVFPVKVRTEEINSYPLVIYENRNNTEDLQKEKKPWPGLGEAMEAYLSIKDIMPIEIIKVKRNEEIFFYPQNTKTEIRMDSGEYKKQTNYLRILMKELPSKNVKYIDLRFGKDIVVKP